jgi:hypothetical protein
MAVCVGEGGTIHRVIRAPTEYGVYAVALGGEPGEPPLLFILEAKVDHPDKSVRGGSRVTVIEVDVGPAGAGP